GNSRLRSVLTESSWSYRYKPAIKGNLQKRLENQSAKVQEISWKAQNRLHDRYLHLLRKGKNKNAVVTAIARELSGFIWAIGQEVEQKVAVEAA
ncbi:hypothetical protein J2Z66_003667, partial [Paenibacillus eucommiae]|nr:hypothetical protein [Paenibacillus eucommiae]